MENGHTSPLEKLRVRVAAEGYDSLRNEDEQQPNNYGRYDDPNRRRKDEAGCSRTEKQLSVLVLVCLIIIVSLVILTVLQHVALSDNSYECTEPKCVEVSGEMLSKMDLSVDPCKDFYSYACGGWIKNAVPPPTKPKWGAFAEISKRNEALLKKVLDEPGHLYKGRNSTAIAKAKMYFKACMNETYTESRGSEPLFRTIKKYGSWTVTPASLSGQWDEKKWDLTTALIQAHKTRVAPLFNMWIGADDKNSSVNIIQFKQYGLSLGLARNYLSNSSKVLRTAYIQYFMEVTKLLGAGNDSYRHAVELWDFETELAKHNLPESEMVDERATYHKMTVQKVQDLVGDQIDIPRYLKEMFGGTEIPLTESVIVYTPKYMAKMGEVVRNSSKELVANYIMWNIVDSLVPYMPMRFRQASLILLKQLKGITSLSPQWEVCVARTDGTLGFASGALYVQDYFKDKSEKETKMIIRKIRESFIANLPKNEWMDEPTKLRAIDKAKAVLEMIGFPEYIRDPAKLDKHYEKLKVTTDPFVNFMNARLYFSWDNLRRRTEKPDRDEWHMVPDTVNAYYNAQFNYIAFPAGILQPPFYNPKAPMSVNFGSAGMVMGHELTHGFDNKGRLFDKYGNMRNWWGNESAQGFAKRAKCLIDQYSAFKVYGQPVKGLMTLGENIADNGGLKTSFKAYQSWLKSHGFHEYTLPGLKLSSNQLFFLGFGQVWCSYYTPQYAKQALYTDPHSPAKYRVIGTLSNMKEFADAYKCAANTPMNPAKKCVIW